MKSSDRRCAVPTCANPAPREYPFCWLCWRVVPTEQKKAVREELRKRGTPDLDRSGLYFAVQTAASAVAEGEMTERARGWEAVYRKAGRL